MEGTLDTFNVVEILQVLGNAKHSGTLHIECPDRQVDVRFVAGRIAETRDSTRALSDTSLGRQLVGRQLISEAQLAEALTEQERSPRPLATLLVEKQFISERDLRQVLSRQIADTLVAAKAAGQGTFVFVRDPQPRAVQHITIDAFEVLIEVSLASDDRVLAFEALGQDSTVLIRNRDYDSLPRHATTMGRDELYLLALIDDRSTVRELIAASRVTEATAVNILSAFAESGIVLAKARGQADADDEVGEREARAGDNSVWTRVEQLFDEE
jgi:hypothetical protein